MPMFTWTDEYELGIPAIDKQHRKWLVLLDGLYTAMREGRASAVIGKVIDEVVSYTKEHFSFEEMLMRSHSYPEYTEHKQLHDEFVKQVAEIRERHESGQMLPAVQVANTMKQWLVDHIQTKDRLYVPYIEGARHRR